MKWIYKSVKDVCRLASFSLIFVSRDECVISVALSTCYTFFFRLQKLIYRYLSTDCFIKISLQTSLFMKQSVYKYR